jgi:predicted RNA-binding Zn-ribbon protein involved in translation (DUF1610 family)
MADDSQSWYARRIAQSRGGTPQAYAPMPQYRGTPPQHQPTAALPLQPQPEQIPMDMLAPEQQWAAKLTAAARSAVQNGVAHRTDRMPCPNCGSNQFFSRATTNKRMPPPAPHCYNCGYNDGMFEQGLEASWAGAARG